MKKESPLPDAKMSLYTETENTFRKEHFSLCLSTYWASEGKYLALKTTKPNIKTTLNEVHYLTVLLSGFGVPSGSILGPAPFSDYKLNLFNLNPKFHKYS